METEIFDKGENANVSKKTGKPKRKLSEKQLEALARGREKRKQKQLEKLTKKGEKERVQQEKDGRQQKKKLMKEQEKVQTAIKKGEEMTAELKSKEDYQEFKKKFNQVKNETLDTIDDPKQWKYMKAYFNKIDLKKYDTIDAVKNLMVEDMEKINNHINKLNKK